MIYIVPIFNKYACLMFILFGSFCMYMPYMCICMLYVCMYVCVCVTGQHGGTV